MDGDVSKWPRRRSSGLEAVPEVTSSVEHGKAQKVSWRAKWRDTIKVRIQPFISCNLRLMLAIHAAPTLKIVTAGIELRFCKL